MTISPLDFIATLDSRPMHIALFYEDEKYARKIEYSFLKNGLARSQHCIYTTHGDRGGDGGGSDADAAANNDNDEYVKKIRVEMMAHGIDADKFERRGLLHILRICDPRDDPLGFERGIDNLKKKILAGKKPPIRLVSRFIRRVESVKDAQANMFVERTIHSNFHDDYPGIFICPYPVDEVPPPVRVEWFLNHMQHHHAAVFAPRSFVGSALVLDRQ
jgi:hypothetical protein